MPFPCWGPLLFPRRPWWWKGGQRARETLVEDSGSIRWRHNPFQGLWQPHKSLWSSLLEIVSYHFEMRNSYQLATSPKTDTWQSKHTQKSNYSPQTAPQVWHVPYNLPQHPQNIWNTGLYELVDKRGSFIHSFKRFWMKLTIISVIMLGVWFLDGEEQS